MPATMSAPSMSAPTSSRRARRPRSRPSSSPRLLRREAGEIAVHQPQHGCPGGAFRHVEDRTSWPRSPASHVGRLDAGDAQEVDDPLEDGAVVGEQLRLVPQRGILPLTVP